MYYYNKLLLGQTKGKKIISVAMISGFLAGCATGGIKADLSADRLGAYKTGNYKSAALNVEYDLGSIDKVNGEDVSTEPARRNVLLHLDAAELWRMSENVERSVRQFDIVENLLKQEDMAGLGESVVEQAGSVLVNDSVSSYVPTPPERILVNFYKAMSFWSSGDRQSANVEFNRSVERAERAEARYRKKIEEANRDADNGKEQDLKKSSASLLQGQIAEKFSNINKWRVYDGFVNPAVEYAHGLFLASSQGSDVEKARFYLDRVSGMVDENTIVSSDLMAISDGGALDQGVPTVWVIYEVGMAPRLKENRFDIPLPIDGNLISLSMALPELTEPVDNFSGNVVQLGDKQLEFEELSDMETLMRTEFKQRWPAVVTRASVSAVAKGILQHTAAEKGGFMGNLIATAYTVGSTKADTRSWEMMPARWKIGREQLGNNKEILISYGDAELSIDLLDGVSQVVYVKQPTRVAKPTVYIGSL